jgi:hypothetical protein
MKKLLLFFIFILCIYFSPGQSSEDYTIQLNVTVQESPPSLLFKWPQDTSCLSYNVGRKLRDATSWTTLATGLADTTTQFIDPNLNMGDAYEYRFTKACSSYSAFTYTYSGIAAPAIEQRGRIILLVDSTFASALSAELTTLISDLTGDGWFVIRHDVSRFDSVPFVKNLIVTDYNADMVNTKAVMIIGHVPVPYSGNLAPDGHPDHFGAWPADVYYGSMSGSWTDISVNATSASRPENINIPGDGKFDQSIIPGTIDLEVGRIDFSNLPQFAFTEEELLRKYLVKDHAYRNKFFSTRPRALVDDNFGAFSGEAFGSSGWRLEALVGADSISSLDYFTTLNTENYQWSYGCGGGSYTSCGGVGSTSDFVNDSVQTIFSMLFGSYFGDWDSQDNFMRSSLASGTTLTCSWSGRPYWHYHHMGLGENIGHSAKVSQNNNGQYAYNNSARGVHMALMGDPTLRMHIIAPPSGLTAIDGGNDQVLLSWNASPDSVLGYCVYRYDSVSGNYIRMNAAIIPATFSADPFPLNNLNQYMVRAIRLEKSASGTYYNLSEGIFSSVSILLGTGTPAATISHLSLFPNPCNGKCTLEFVSADAADFKLTVLNTSGQVVLETSGESMPGINHFSILTGDLPAGIYFMKILSEEGMVFQKLFLKNK